MADLCVSWCLCHTTGVMHQWRCACWFTDVCNDAPAVIMMLLSSKYLNTCAIFDAFVTLLVWCTNGAVRADLLMYVMMHQQSLWCYLAVSIWILVQFLSSGSLFHSHQGSLTHRQKSQRLAAEPAIMMFNDIPCIAVGLEITHSLNSSIQSFIVFLAT